MRIVFVTGSLVHGGAERHSIGLLNRLAERGHECHAVYVKNDPSQRDRLRPGPDGTIECLEAQRFLDRDALARFAAHLTALRPTAIVAANDYALMYAALARWLAGLAIPLAATFHTTRILGHKEQIKMIAARCLFPLSDCLVFVCATQRDYWRRRGVFARRVDVIHNGVDAAAFDPARFSSARIRVRRRYGFAADDFVVGLSAVLRPEKNHLQLLDAVAALRAERVPAKALLIGDGPMRPAVEDRIRALGLEAHATITGFCEDVRPCLAACDATTICSTGVETFSLAALEAMSMGKPVVHSDVGGAREMIADGHNGYVFPTGDTEALRHCLALLSDPARARPMGASARHVVEGRFSETAMVDRYEQLLDALCASPQPATLPEETPAWPAMNDKCETRSQST